MKVLQYSFSEDVNANRLDLSFFIIPFG